LCSVAAGAAWCGTVTPYATRQRTVFLLPRGAAGPLCIGTARTWRARDAVVRTNHDATIYKVGAKSPLVDPLFLHICTMFACMR
jgi:hypothetical protein